MQLLDSTDHSLVELIICTVDRKGQLHHVSHIDGHMSVMFTVSPKERVLLSERQTHWIKSTKLTELLDYSEFLYRKLVHTGKYRAVVILAHYPLLVYLTEPKGSRKKLCDILNTGGLDRSPHVSDAFANNSVVFQVGPT